MSDFDIVVIGAGAAGLSVTAGAAQLGARVALIERDHMGGDCLNIGCVPSKALLAAAHAAQAARDAGRLGIRLPEPDIDWAGVQAHVRGAIAAIAPNDSVERFTALGATVIRGHARFVAPDAVQVDGRRITAKRFVIAAGGRAAVPPIPGLDQVPFLTNATLFHVAQRPDHLLILGGGPIGLEMAQAHRRLGCRVTVAEAGTISGRDDPELVDVVRQTLLTEGVTLIEGTAVSGVEPGPTLVLADGRRVGGSHLLVATGRRPNIEDLGLDAGGIAHSPRGIATDRGLRSSTNRRVFVAGDIADPQGIGPRFFTHVGGYHAGLLIRRLLFRLPVTVDYAALPRVTYTDPELAQVGLTEAEARDAGHAPTLLRWPLAENDRAVAEGRTEGLAKLVVGRRGRLLGAGVAAPGAGDIIAALGLAVARRLSASALAGQIVAYPTRAEAPKRAAGNLFVPRLFSPGTRRVVGWLLKLP
jgi:pyruvate/2-oxoglutarate dehydrogenase complex dihydrolipoamide dehydrogenase (E3) component